MIINSRYKVIKLIGSGRTKVFLVEDLKVSDRLFALKIISRENLIEEEIESLREEFNLLNNISHPNILKVYEYGMVTDCEDKALNGSYFYISEFVEGKNLFEFFTPPISDNKLELFLYTLNQICLTLYYIHQLNVIHYDIRPENILIEGYDGKDITIKIIDFGFSALKSSYVRGTPLYISPELISGKEIDYRTDLYSLGATLYHILTGSPPFYSDNEIDLLKKHLEETPNPLPSDLPDYLNKIVLKLLEKNPHKRFNNSLEILNYIPEKFAKYKNIWPIPRLHFARKEELKQLIDFAAGNDLTISTIIVISEYGMGKSYLLKKFIAHLQCINYDYIYLNVSENQTTAFDILEALLIQIEQLVAKQEFAEKEEIVKKILSLRELYNYGESGGEFLEYRRNYLSELLINIAKLFKLLIIIDDYHLTDQVTKNFFSHIFPSLTDLGMKFVLSVDTSFVRNEFFERLRNHKEIILSPLTKNEILQMLKSYFNFDFPYEDVADLLIEYTPRSINAIHEVLMRLFLNDLLTFDSNGFKLHKEIIEKTDFHHVLSNTYENYIINLTETQKLILEILSLLNFPISIDELSSITNKDINQIKKEINFLISFGWVEFDDRSKTLLLPFGGIKNFLSVRTKEKIELNHILAQFFEKRGYQHFIVAEFYEKSGEKEKALNYYLEAAEDAEKFYSFTSLEKFLKKCIELEPSETENNNHKFRLAKCYFNLGEFNQAKMLLTELIKNASFRGSKSFEMYLMLAITKYKTGEIEEAYKNFDVAFKISETDIQKIEVELNQINLELGQGNYSIVISKCKNLLQEYKNVLSPNSRADVLNNLGIANSHIGAYSDAISYFQDALEIYEELENKIKSAQVLMNLGNVLNILGQQDEALLYWNRALELNEAIGDLSKKARILNNIGISFFENFELENAIKYYENSSNIFEKINDQFGVALSLYNLAEAYYLMSEYENTTKYLEKSIQISKKLHDIEGQCLGLFLLGLVNYTLYQLQEVRKLSFELISLIEINKMQPAQLQNCLYLDGLLKLKERDYSEAEVKLNLAREIFKEIDRKYFYCKCTLDLMRLYFYTGNFKTICELYSELTLNIYFQKNKLLQAEANLILGDAAKRPGADFSKQPLHFYSEALKLIENTYIGEVTFQVLIAIGEEYLTKGAIRRGIDFFNKANWVINYLASKITNNELKNRYLAQPDIKRMLNKIEKVINSF